MENKMSKTKGVIYIMSTAVNGLIKIGRTMTRQFDERMRYLEKHGYYNVTGLKREFAIELVGYEEKEQMLHTIFQKSQIGKSELFALNKDNAIQLLTSFDGDVIFPVNENKNDIFENVTENIVSKSIPNGLYYFKKQKKSDNKIVSVTAQVENGIWTILKGSIIGIIEDKGVSQKAKNTREYMKFDKNGLLLENIVLGECTPSFAGTLIMNGSINGWTDWYDKSGNQLCIYKEKNLYEEE